MSDFRSHLTSIFIVLLPLFCIEAATTIPPWDWSTCNQYSVASQLNRLTSPTASQTLLTDTIAGLNPIAAQEALTSLSGYQYSNDIVVLENVNRQFLRRLYDPLRDIVTEPTCDDYCLKPSIQTYDLWLEGGATISQYNGNAAAHGFNAVGYAITGGGQCTFYSDWTVGLAGTYERDALHYKHKGGSGTDQSWLAGLYGLYRPECCYAIADIVVGYSSDQLHRNVVVGTLEERTRGKAKTSQFAFYGEMGVDMNVHPFMFQPFGAIDVSHYCRHHLSESDLYGWNLSIKRKSTTITSTRIGIHMTTKDWPGDWSLSTDLAWNRRLTGRHNSLKALFVEFGSQFTVRGVTLCKDSLDYAVTLASPTVCGWTAYLEGSGEMWSRVSDYNILGHVDYHW